MKLRRIVSGTRATSAASQHHLPAFFVPRRIASRIFAAAFGAGSLSMGRNSNCACMASVPGKSPSFQPGHGLSKLAEVSLAS